MKTKISAARIKLKRAYARANADDGTRILVDRLWPRGIKKSTAAINLWVKELSPSGELRKWFGHDPARWLEFSQRYRGELRGRPRELNKIRELAKMRTITLVYGARNEIQNHAVVLRDVLLGRRVSSVAAMRLTRATGTDR